MKIIKSLGYNIKKPIYTNILPFKFWGKTLFVVINDYSNSRKFYDLCTVKYTILSFIFLKIKNGLRRNLLLNHAVY